MAFNTVQTAVIQEAGYTPAKLTIYGTYASSAGGTGGVIAPGYINADTVFTAYTDASIGGRYSYFLTLTSGTADAVTQIVVPSFNATLDRQVFTITTSANGTGFYKIECVDNGA